jgi:hypothetical protein
MDLIYLEDPGQARGYMRLMEVVCDEVLKHA